jgi:hypothetical protein
MAISLTGREREYFDFLRRYRISTPTINIELCGGSESAAKKLPLRLKEYIASEPLGASVYYRPTPAGARLMGIPDELGRALGIQSLPKALAIAGFCFGGTTKRPRYLRTEFIEDLPEFSSELLSNDFHTDFFLDHDGHQARLGQIVVDLGGDYKKLISKCRMRLREYLDIPRLRDLVSDGLFTYAIVVAEEEKAQAIRLLISQKPLKARVIVETSSELRKCPLQLGGLE